MKAYSNPVMEASISLNAIKTYLFRGSVNYEHMVIYEKHTIQFESKHSAVIRVNFRLRLRKYQRNNDKGLSV